jgi:hypothetical protein
VWFPHLTDSDAAALGYGSSGDLSPGKYQATQYAAALADVVSKAIHDRKAMAAAASVAEAKGAAGRNQSAKAEWKDAGAAAREAEAKLDDEVLRIVTMLALDGDELTNGSSKAANGSSKATNGSSASNSSMAAKGAPSPPSLSMMAKSDKPAAGSNSSKTSDGGKAVAAANGTSSGNSSGDDCTPVVTAGAYTMDVLVCAEVRGLNLWFDRAVGVDYLA